MTKVSNRALYSKIDVTKTILCNTCNEYYSVKDALYIVDESNAAITKNAKPNCPYCITHNYNFKIRDTYVFLKYTIDRNGVKNYFDVDFNEWVLDKKCNIILPKDKELRKSFLNNLNYE